MNYLKRQMKKNSDDAISPVVGVMLMLVVTIIIAAVVSGFSGGLIAGNNQKTPALTMDVKISNTGSYIGSGFTATVTSVSEPIATKDIRIQTSWKTTNKDSGASMTGGNTSMPLVKNVMSPKIASGDTQPLIASIAPYGSGPGVTGSQNPSSPFSQAAQQFGNYSLMQGTGLVALPYGSHSGMAIAGAPGVTDDGGYGIPISVNAASNGPYKYTFGASFVSGAVDATQAVLGTGWENLRAGDTVTVSVVHVPSGKVIFKKDVSVTEG